MNIKEEDKKYIWHPFTQMKGAEIIPIVKGEGVYLIDEEGNKYIDAVSSWWVNLHGHSHPYIGDKIIEQYRKLEHVAFGGFTHPIGVKVAQRLIEMLPSKIVKIFYSDNGSTANEVALKMAIQYWVNQGQKRNLFVAFEGSYHGDTFGSMSVTQRGTFNTPFENHFFEVEFIPTPTEQNIKVLEVQLNNLLVNNRVNAFVFEPIIQGVRGMKVHSPELLDRLILICQQHKVLTIADEVMTGFGRTGKMFASDYLQNTPDIIALSKGLTGGVLPCGVTACSEEVYGAFYSDDRHKTFLHGHSFTGNPLSCAAIDANLDLLNKKETLDSIQRITFQQQHFVEKIKNHRNILEAHFFGTIVSLELKTPNETSYFNEFSNYIYDYFIKRGIVLRPLGNILVLVPPYCITEDELELVQNEILLFIDAF